MFKHTVISSAAPRHHMDLYVFMHEDNYEQDMVYDEAWVLGGKECKNAEGVLNTATIKFPAKSDKDQPDDRVEIDINFLYLI